jgi:hypothetical protein
MGSYRAEREWWLDEWFTEWLTAYCAGRVLCGARLISYADALSVCNGELGHGSGAVGGRCVF